MKPNSISCGKQLEAYVHHEVALGVLSPRHRAYIPNAGSRVSRRLVKSRQLLLGPRSYPEVHVREFVPMEDRVSQYSTPFPRGTPTTAKPMRRPEHGPSRNARARSPRAGWGFASIRRSLARSSESVQKASWSKRLPSGLGSAAIVPYASAMERIWRRPRRVTASLRWSLASARNIERN